MKQIALISSLVVIVILILLALIRAIKGPRMADRVVGINIIGTLTSAAISILAVMLNENWLLDVCLVYGLISFLSVIVVAKIGIINHKEDKENQDYD